MKLTKLITSNLSYLCYAALLIFLILVPVMFSGQYYLGILMMILINILLASSLWFIMTTGQLTFGHAGFAAIGAYFSAALITSYGQSSWLSLVVAVIISGIIATIIGYLTLRIKGIYFIVVTLALGQAITIIFSMIDHPFGGQLGLINLPPPDPIAIPGLPAINFDSPSSIYYLVLIFTLLGVVIMNRLNKSRIGLIYKGISQADNLAEHVGINIMAQKVQAFVIGSMFASLAGVLYTYHTESILPSSFTLAQSTYYIVYMCVGGVASIIGPILGTTILYIVSILLRPAQEFEPIIYGLLLMACMLFFKSGLLGLILKLWDNIKGRYFNRNTALKDY